MGERQSQMHEKSEAADARAWHWLSTMLPVEELTATTDVSLCRWTDRDAAVDAVGRNLMRRRNPHVLITGEEGVGKTTLVKQVAAAAMRRQSGFPAEARFLWVDCTNVGPEDSRACLETLVTAASGEVPVVLCLDGFDRLLVRPNGGTNKPLLRATAARKRVRFIGILSRWAFEELIAGDAAMLDLFTRVDIDEPTEEVALIIARHQLPGLKAEFGVDIPDDVAERAVTLSGNYCLGEAHPSKGIKVLERACEDAEYDRRHLAREHSSLTISDVIRVISERTGIPAATIAGDSGETDFEAALTEAVVGQEAAVAAVANELRLVKAGLVEPGKPAAVFLFAGMTGVGKTELAKRIAELYSSSRRLQAYAMGNFTEPHSVSGIIGVPPGYVGHDQGGRLVNELNADPYAVFLLDEAEKAHPNVWKPFLNLFDEGWITDQRGTKAYADRAIFVLTTNAGDNAIAQMTKQGKSDEEIVERVKQTLAKFRIDRSTQPVFTPQFLSRIGRIVVFSALDEPAMVGIVHKHVQRTQSLWLKRREKQVHVPESLIRAIGRACHSSNEQSGGKEGGRIVRRMIADVIESRIQQLAMRGAEAYRNCTTIRLSYQTPANDEDCPLRGADVGVSFEERTV